MFEEIDEAHRGLRKEKQGEGVKRPVGLININSNSLCAISIETTGEVPGEHDLIELCIMLLDEKLDPFLKISPFYCFLKPKRPDNAEKRYKREKLCKAQLEGLDPDFAADFLGEWFAKLNMPRFKKIMPLTHNWPLVRDFLVDWLGQRNFNHYFDYRYRDLLPTAIYENDAAEFRVEQFPYPKVFFQFLCSCTRTERRKPHDTFSECRIMAEVYKKIIFARF